MTTLSETNLPGQAESNAPATAGAAPSARCPSCGRTICGDHVQHGVRVREGSLFVRYVELRCFACNLQVGFVLAVPNGSAPVDGARLAAAVGYLLEHATHPSPDDVAQRDP